jgi:four helix bundle protein
MPSHGYRDLVVWQRAMEFVTMIYRTTDQFPKTEVFALTNQIRRAIVSVPSNIAEGRGRNSDKEFVHYISIAYGSLMETETQLQIACNLGYINQAEVERLLVDAAEIGRMLNGLSRSLRPDKNKSS